VIGVVGLNCSLGLFEDLRQDLRCVRADLVGHPLHAVCQHAADVVQRRPDPVRPHQMALRLREGQLRLQRLGPDVPLLPVVEPGRVEPLRLLPSDPRPPDIGDDFRGVPSPLSARPDLHEGVVALAGVPLELPLSKTAGCACLGKR